MTTLTPRQRQILALMVDGYSGKQIARQLAINPHTVKRHLQGAYARLEIGDCGNRGYRAVALMAQTMSAPTAHAEAD
jgi:DNA-binding CsgD family transcriptional regulator